MPPPPAAVAPVGPRYVLVPERRYERMRRARRRHPGRGMTIAGIALFGASYLVPAMIATVVAAEPRDTCDCRDALRMWIPIAGPLTLLHSGGDYAAFNTLLAFDAVMQGAGVLLAVFGMAIAAASNEPEDEYGLRSDEGLSVSAAPLPGGAYASLRLRL